MDARVRRQRIDDLTGHCRTKGISLTVQRRAILTSIVALEGHPTADQVHAAVVRAAPAISRTTVYRTLETFVRTGVITKVCHPGNAVRYDARTEKHHHLVCTRCESMVDLSDPGLDALHIPDTSALGFEVVDFRVQMRGICRRCRRLEARK